MSKNSIQIKITVADEQMSFPSKSEAIRYLDKNGMARGAIAKLIDCRYQMVKNILDKAAEKKKAE